MGIFTVLATLGKVLLPSAALSKVVVETVKAAEIFNDVLVLATKARTKKAISEVVKLEHRGETRLKNIALVAARFKKKPPFKGFTFDFEEYTK